MILYTNGDSHTAGAEAVNPFFFAEEDPKYINLKKQPHPDNLAVSWSTKLADHFGMELVCDAESGSSNHRILRTTRNFIDNFSKSNNRSELLVVIGWSGWIREEWLIDDEYYQINNTGVGHLPYDWNDKYKEYIANANEDKCVEFWNDQIYKFSLDLRRKGIKHIFFNCYQSLKNTKNPKLNWKHYIEPYNDEGTYDSYLKSNDIKPKQNYHYGEDGHKIWSNFLIDYIEENDIIR